MNYILAIDQGTTGTTTVAYGSRGEILASAYREISQYYPRPGWVEHDPDDIWRSVVATIEEVVAKLGQKPVSVGITNQRETTVLWDQRTGAPIHKAIVWQCRRTADLCDTLKPQESFFRKRTGLPIDPYFSGTKIRWVLDNVQGADAADVMFGTIDTWLIWKLTGGAVHATDLTNASRTLLLNIHTQAWDVDLCDRLGIRMSLLPEVRHSVDHFGGISTVPCLKGVSVNGVAGDQQAAMVGQACFLPGEMKNTYGTGCFMLMNTGERAVHSRNGLLTTLVVGPDGGIRFALEGAIFAAGAAVQWLRDELGIIQTAAESEECAARVPDTGGVYMVPAFAGLGAPYWKPEARAMLTGLTRGSNRNHLIRAALESIAFQSHEIFSLMEKESGKQAPFLAVDGGACANNLLMQFQADILNRPVKRPANVESTSQGAAYLAGLGAGIWNSTADLVKLNKCERVFEPAMDTARRTPLIGGWRKAVRQTLAD